MIRRNGRLAGRGYAAPAASLVLVLMTLLGCSVPSAEETSDPPVSPNYYSSYLAVCGLVRTGDLRAITGYEYLEGIDTFTLALQGVTGITKCIYEPKRPPRKFVTTGVVYAYASQIFDEVKRARSGLASEAVAGLGETAVWYPDASELLVLVQGNMLGVNLTADVMESDAHIQERARRLIEIMIARLK